MPKAANDGPSEERGYCATAVMTPEYPEGRSLSEFLPGASILNKSPQESIYKGLTTSSSLPIH